MQKKDGGVRFCVDCRKLNRVTKLAKFSLPRINDTLDRQAGSRHFSTLDLASGYWQVEVESSSMDVSGLYQSSSMDVSGLYQFWKMPFGLYNTPVTFQRLIKVVLSDLARNMCVVYLDNIVVFGRSLLEHNSNLTQVLHRL